MSPREAPTGLSLRAGAFWLAVAAWNLATGMAAGYALMSEAPLFLAIFLPPALLALWIRVRFHYA